MNRQEDQPIPVKIDGNKKVVLAVPAKPKPPESWWKRNADYLLIIWGCFMMIIYLMVNP